MMMVCPNKWTNLYPTGMLILRKPRQLEDHHHTIRNSQSKSGKDSRGRNKDSIVDLVYGKCMDDGDSKGPCEYIGGTESDAK